MALATLVSGPMGVRGRSCGMRQSFPCQDSDQNAAAKNWYAVQTRSRHEKKVAAWLADNGIQAYLPLVREVHLWSDRRKVVEVPLFPGYAFIRSSGSAATAVRVFQTDGVVSMVGPGLCGTPIPDQEIEAVQRLLAHETPCMNHPFLKVGQKVRIRGGALDGIEGILLACKSENRLVVSVEMIQRSLAVPIEGYDVQVL
jgi:transcription antitermination factor NusG